MKKELLMGLCLLYFNWFLVFFYGYLKVEYQKAVHASKDYLSTLKADQIMNISLSALLYQR